MDQNNKNVFGEVIGIIYGATPFECCLYNLKSAQIIFK